MSAHQPTFIQRLRDEIDLEILQLQAVATGQADIHVVNQEYKHRRNRIRRDLQRLGLTDPNTWGDLWLWYGHYRDDSELSSYQSRRELVIHLYQPLLEVLDHLEDRQLGTGLRPPQTGWALVDHQTRELRERYAIAQTIEDFKDVGLRCREILISLGQCAYDVSRHAQENEAPLKSSDAKGRLCQIVQAELPGGQNAELRQLLRSLIEAAWVAAGDLVHDRRARLVQASLVANSALLVASTVRELLPEADAALEVDLWEDRTPHVSGMTEHRDRYDDESSEPTEEDLEYMSYLAAKEGWD